jgi:16S rRNA (guanine(966)-N(2))-methyltransferase RsmD
MLRITAGEHRGRRLKVPEVAATRPLVERAREGLFNHLRDLLPEAMVWDVYAGSGILALEALSRGAAHAVAIEKHPRAAAQLKANAEALGCQERLQVLRVDAHRLSDLGTLDAPDLLFFDPPYDDFRKGGERRVRTWALFLELAGGIRPGGAAVVHTPRGILSSAELAPLPGIERRDYGSTSLYWWHKPA